jgi:hypothetical protein
MLDSDDLFDVSISYTIHTVMEVHGCITVVNPQFNLPARLKALTLGRSLKFQESVNGMQGL